MKDHVVICGYGYNGKKLAEELDRRNIEYIIIDKREDAFKELKKIKTKKIVGDGKDEETLKKAYIKEARTLLITVSSDVEAAFISLVAKKLNPSLNIIVKANKLESINKLYQAGATKVVSPLVIGGKLAAKYAIRPFVAEFLDMITFTKDLDITQFKVEKDSHFNNKKIKDLNLSQKKISILAIYRKGNLLPNPSPDLELKPEDIVVILGSSKEIRELTHH
jgi:voltage-gated potassium channel